MRIVGGKFRGRTLAGPSSQAIRPTSDRTRESIFNILAHAYGDPVTGSRVLYRDGLPLGALSSGEIQWYADLSPQEETAAHRLLMREPELVAVPVEIP